MTLFILLIVAIIIYYFFLYNEGINKKQKDKIEKCPNCNSKVEEYFNICPVCKETLKRKCNNCGERLEVFWNFCPYCENPTEKSDKV